MRILLIIFLPFKEPSAFLGALLIGVIVWIAVSRHQVAEEHEAEGLRLIQSIEASRKPSTYVHSCSLSPVGIVPPQREFSLP